MNILVTGAKGFLGRNLVENLKNIRDGKNRTRPNLAIGEIFQYDVDSSSAQLEEYCAQADFVFNLAGVNRPKDPAEFREGNFGFAGTLLDTLKRCGNTCPVMLSSSVQATLSGRFGDSEYGRSKLAGEELFFAYGEETGARVLVYRFPNLVGKWVRPNYNSAVGTFCHNIANDLPITVNDPTVELELLFVDDLIEELLDALEGREHRCDFDGAQAVGVVAVNPEAPAAGTAVGTGQACCTCDGSAAGTGQACCTCDGSAADTVGAPVGPAGRYCWAPVTHKATLGYIVSCLEKFHDQPKTLVLPAIPEGSFEKKLYSMYLSYLPEEKVAFDLKMNADERGSFTELMKTLDSGQISVNISKPGITKGQHWHNSKWEFFIVVSGHGLIEERKIGSDDGEVWRFEVSGEKLQAVHMLPGYTHSITNLSETENLVTVMWANEQFDPLKPDTYFEEV